MKNQSLVPRANNFSTMGLLFRVLTLFFFIVAFVRPVIAASSYYWVGGGSTASAPASGNWDATTTDWSTTATGPTGTAWGAAGSLAVFGGVDGTYGVSVNATVNKPQSLQFLNSGYTLSNTTTPQTITFNGTGAGATPNLQVAAGKTAVIGTNITVASTQTTIWGNPTGTTGGELDIQNGATFAPGGATAGQVGVGTLTSVKPGGKVTFSSSTTTFIIGSATPDNSVFSVDGGAVSFLGSTTIQSRPANGAGVVAGTLTVNSGSLTMLSGNTTVGMVIGANTSNLGTNNLNGGIESVNKISQSSGSGYINFNGGTLQAVNGAFASTFLTGLTRANVRTGAAVIDNNSFGLTLGPGVAA